MTNPFYNKGFDVLQGSSNRSDAVEGEFQAVEQGFDAINSRFAAIDPYNAELVAARQGQSSLLANLGRYLNTFAAATANLNMGGFRITNHPAPIASTDLARKQEVDDARAYAAGLSFATVLPAQAGNAGRFVKTDGTTASWADLNNETPIQQARRARSISLIAVGVI